MTLRAGFAEADITPQIGCQKAGWIVPITIDRIRDPLFAKAAVLESGGQTVAIVGLDVLSVRWTQVEQIRAGGEKLGIPAGNILVAATHSHGGPAVVNLGLVPRDDDYLAETLVPGAAEALRLAVDRLAPAGAGFATGTEGRCSHIRRAIMRDGSVKTHAQPDHPDIICQEGVLDPQLAALMLRDGAGNPLGAVVNFTCHPTDQGGNTAISADWPGELAEALRRTWGRHFVTVIVNGAFGDISPHGPLHPEHMDMVEKARLLARRVEGLVGGLVESGAWGDDLQLGAASQTVQLPLRDIDGPHGRDHKFRQRFGGELGDEYYDSSIEVLWNKKKQRDHALAEVQRLNLREDLCFVAIPGEYFSKLGLEIKHQSAVRYTLIAGASNGMVSYIPDRDAFDRGGYETTLAMSSKLAPGTGEMLRDAALDLLGRK